MRQYFVLIRQREEQQPFGLTTLSRCRQNCGQHQKQCNWTKEYISVENGNWDAFPLSVYITALSSVHCMQYLYVKNPQYSYTDRAKASQFMTFSLKIYILWTERYIYNFRPDHSPSYFPRSSVKKTVSNY